MLKILLLSSWFLFHPVHVTLTSIDYIPETESFKVFVRMYFDDFISDYKLTGKVINNKGFSGEEQMSRDIMESYLSEKIVIEVNDKHLSGNLEDMKLADNEISMNLQYGPVKRPKLVKVKNLIMTGLYGDQLNMIIVRINSFEEGVRLTSDLTEKIFKIK